MIYLKTNMEKMPENCRHCSIYADCDAEPSWTERPRDCMYVEDSYKAKAEELMRLIKREFPQNSGHANCSCPRCSLYKKIKKIMEGV